MLSTRHLNSVLLITIVCPFEDELVATASQVASWTFLYLTTPSICGEMVKQPSIRPAAPRIQSTCFGIETTEKRKWLTLYSLIKCREHLAKSTFSPPPESPALKVLYAPDGIPSFCNLLLSIWISVSFVIPGSRRKSSPVLM